MTDRQIATEPQAQNRLITTWARATEEVFEALAGAKPELEWKAFPQGQMPLGQDDSLEWWEAVYQGIGEFRLWVGVPGPAALALGRLANALAAANAKEETTEPPVVREMVLSLADAFSRLLSAELRQPVRYGELVHLDIPPEAELVYSTEVKMPEGAAFRMLVAFHDPQAGSTGVRGEVRTKRETDSDSPLGHLRNIELPLTIRLGRVELPLEQVLALKVGSVLELQETHDDPVDVLVNGSIVARGEVVAVDGNYGVRILELPGNGGQPSLGFLNQLG